LSPVSHSTSATTAIRGSVAFISYTIKICNFNIRSASILFSPMSSPALGEKDFRKSQTAQNNEHAIRTDTTRPRSSTRMEAEEKCRNLTPAPEASQRPRLRNPPTMSPNPHQPTPGRCGLLFCLNFENKVLV
jgi:hypothetical protein